MQLFSNNNQELPKLNLDLPKIKQNMPRIKVTEDADLLFDIDGQNVSMDEVAEKFSKLYFQS